MVKWLTEESYAISRLDLPPDTRVSWSIGVSTPGIPSIKFTVLIPMDRQDRVVLAMGVIISPEHRQELEKTKLTERIRAIHSIFSRALMTCSDCKIVIQPSMVNPQTITINLEVFEDELTKYGKPYFIKALTRFINTYLVIVSGFNELFPIVQSDTKETHFYI